MKRKFLLFLLIIPLVVVVGFSAVFIFIKRPVISVDENNLPQFIQANFIDINNNNNLGVISKFRSGAGHDFSDSTSTCSSMKHYFDPYGEDRLDIVPSKPLPPAPTAENGVKVYSPVDGSILSISEEQFPLGKQFNIVPTSHPEFHVRLFHVYPAENVKEGNNVKAGELIGYINKGQGMDVAIEASALQGRSFFSYFEVLPDHLFQPFKDRGAKSKNDFIITEQERKANPLQCDGEQFVNGQEQYNLENKTKNYVDLSKVE